MELLYKLVELEKFVFLSWLRVSRGYIYCKPLEGFQDFILSCTSLPTLLSTMQLSNTFFFQKSGDYASNGTLCTQEPFVCLSEEDY